MTRTQMYFGTESSMRFIPVPLQGADMSPVGWGADGTYLSGGGWVDQSYGTHKQYVFEWNDSSSRQVAQLVKSYRDGTYGRGPLYFVDPLIYDLNILPAHWADPSMGIDNGARSLVAGVHPTGIATTSAAQEGLPVRSAVYDLADVAEGYRGEYESLFIPIPPGHTLAFGYQGAVTGNGRVSYRTQAADGTLGTVTHLTALANTSTVMTNATSTAFGIRLWVGKSAAGAGTVTIAAMTARLYPTGATAPTAGPWIGGMGHSGCKFVGAPTYIANSGEAGGRIGFAATFREVGSWL